MLAAATYALFLWWLTTGVVLYVCGLPRHTHRASFAVATMLLALSLAAFTAASAATGPLAAVAAFTSAVCIFGWHEMSYYMGFVAGPRRVACEPGAGAWRRFRLGVAVSLWHELAVVATAALLVALAHDAPNQAGTWTFLVLWWMRWSAKLNLFLGVPNLQEGFLPPELRYLATYMRRRPMNPLWPCSVLLGAGLAAWQLAPAFAPGADAGTRAGAALVATIAALAVLEHVFFVLPLNEAALWGWGLRSRKAGARERLLGTGRP